MAPAIAMRWPRRHVRAARSLGVALLATTALLQLSAVLAPTAAGSRCWAPSGPGPRRRRALLSGPLVALRPSASWARGGEEASRSLLRELNGEEAVSNPGESWNLGRFLPNKPGQQLIWPAWMAGTWNVSTKFLGASAPMGRRYVTDRTPGTRKGTLLALPDVGREPSFLQRFLPAEGGAVADRAFNIRQRLEAFLPEARVGRVAYDAVQEPTRVSVDYSTPGTVRGERTRRAVELFVNNRAGDFETEDSFVCAELFRQTNAELARSGDYKVILGLRKFAGGEVLGKLRVGVFLTPLDEAYFDVGGRAVAVYDYSLRISMVEAVQAASVG